MVTTLVPINNSSASCENQLLMKTLMVPIIDHRGCTEITMKDGKIFPRYGNGSQYFLISRDAVISKETRFFGKTSHIIGRMCTVDILINATTTPSPDVLFEVFTLKFEGNLTLNETCTHNSTSSSIIRKISSQATIKLPVVCSVSSERFNCGAITLRSAETKEIYMTHHRMIIQQDKLVEKEVEINRTTFVKSEVPPPSAAIRESTSLLHSIKLYQTPLIITGAVLAAILLMALPAKLMMNRSGNDKPINFNNYNSANSSNINSNSNTMETPPKAFLPCPRSADAG